MVIYSDNLNKRIETTLLWLTVLAIIASAFHFWPFTSSPLWKVANIANLSIIAGAVIVIVYNAFWNLNKTGLQRISIPLSIWAYLLFHVLSSAYADTLSRPVIYTYKIFLVMAGGYLLFIQAMNRSNIHWVCWSIIVACGISLFSALYTQYGLQNDCCGFFENTYKYGTYMSIVGSFGIVYLLAGRGFWHSVFAFILLLGLACTFQNIGGMIGTLSGLAAGLIGWKGLSRKVLYLAILAFILAGLFLNPAILRDSKILENDGQNLRQRYIEWQAELNMLQRYGITGSGAGSINDYRSEYYDRMPKLNTLQPFDQNGWVTIPAEIGLMGLFCFIWILYEHGRYVFRNQPEMSPEISRVRVALKAAFVACCVGNLFSSVHYNGVLIGFVLILGLSKSIDQLNRKG